MMVHLVIILICIVVNFSNGFESFTHWDIKEIMLKGKQDERIQTLSYDKVCGCQCKDLSVFVQGRNRIEGNCLHKLRGRYWCYISDEAAKFCKHSEDGKFQHSKWSIDACYTPAPGEGPCDGHAHDDTPSLTLCALHKGQYNSGPFDYLKDIIDVCYDPNGDTPEDSCSDAIETSLGPAKPCRCKYFHWIYKNGAKSIGSASVIEVDHNTRYFYCDEDVAVGSQLVYMSPAVGIAQTKRKGVFKRSNNCVWKQVPKRVGPWKCLRRRRSQGK